MMDRWKTYRHDLPLYVAGFAKSSPNWGIQGHVGMLDSNVNRLGYFQKGRSRLYLHSAVLLGLARASERHIRHPRPILTSEQIVKVASMRKSQRLGDASLTLCFLGRDARKTYKRQLQTPTSQQHSNQHSFTRLPNSEIRKNNDLQLDSLGNGFQTSYHVHTSYYYIIKNAALAFVLTAIIVPGQAHPVQTPSSESKDGNCPSLRQEYDGFSQAVINCQG